MSIIKTQDLRKEYGSKGMKFQALNGIDLEVEKSEFLAIMGPSGSGKTTLLNILSTIDKPSSGKVVFDGKDMFCIKSEELARFRRDKIGFVFQDFNLLDNMTVMDNIALPLALNKVHHKDISSKVSELAGFFGIEQQLVKYPYQLSGGQKQRVAAARALIMNPSVIFADEPTGALDSKASAELLECFRKLNKQYGTTIIMVTHDAFAASYCNRIMFLKDGAIHARLDKTGERKELFHRILDMLGAMGGVNTNELL
jgi:putative ABC transport system ATP-binding protein